MAANFPASYCRAGALWRHLHLNLAPDLTRSCLPLTLRSWSSWNSTSNKPEGNAHWCEGDASLWLSKRDAWKDDNRWEWQSSGQSWNADNACGSNDPWNVNNAKASDVRDSRTSVEHIPCANGAFCNVRKVSGRGNYGRTSHCAAVVTFPSNSDRERVMTYRQRDRAGLRRRHAFADARSIRL